MDYLDYEGLKRYNELLHNEIQDNELVVAAALDEIKEEVGMLTHQYVDLGLPSGTLWATMNVGATSVTDYGNYYMYGMGAKTYQYSDTPYQGMEDPLPEEYDTAAQVWGEGWRMPTQAQIEELVNNATYQWVTNYQGSGINGSLVTGPNGNTIFLPAAGYYDYTSGALSSVGSYGYYWSATLFNANNVRALVSQSSYLACSYIYRTNGVSVRPVHVSKIKETIGISSNGSTSKYLDQQGNWDTIESKTASSGSSEVSLVTRGEKYTWNNKQDSLQFNTAPSSSNKVATMSDIPTTMVASGSNHAGGLVPDTPNTAGSIKFLCEDGTWKIPMTGETIHPLSSVSGTAAVTETPFSAAVWTGSASEITSIYSNLTVSIKVPVAGNATYGTVLNINGLGNHPVLLNVSTMLSTQYAVGCIIELTYDAEATADVYINSETPTTITGCWKIADYNTNTTYTNAKLGQGYATCETAAATAAKVATLSSYSLVAGGIVTVKFTYDVPANATLSINSQTAKAIYHKGAKITAGVIKAGDFATFIYSGYYHLISLNRNFDDAFGGSGSSHKSGLVPDPGSTAGTTKFLREDGSWQVPAYPAAQVQSDWNATTGMGVILNKPTILPTPVSVVSGSSVTQQLSPNVFYSFGTMTNLSVTLGTPTSGITNEYIFEFDSGSTATNLSVPNTVKWPETLNIKANTHYEISIKYDVSNTNYYGLFVEWPNS